MAMSARTGAIAWRTLVAFAAAVGLAGFTLISAMGQGAASTRSGEGLRRLVGPALLGQSAAAPRDRLALPGEHPPEVTKRSVRTIDRGLRFLAKVQASDGSYGKSRYSPTTYPTAITSMAGLAFLASGSTPGRGPYARNLQKITDYLLRNCVSRRRGQQGYLTNDDAWEQRPTYCHAFAMTYLSQVYAVERDPRRRATLQRVLERAIELCAQTQTRDGGWGYGPNYYEDEGTLVVTQLQGLRACRDAGFYVPKQVIDDGVEFIERSTNANGSVRYRIHSNRVRPGVSCAAIVALWNAGRYKDPLLRRIRGYVDRNIRVAWSSGHHQEYVLYYHAQARWVLGGEEWLEFYRDASAILSSEQRSDGSFEGSDGGDLFGTATALLVLQLPYDRLSVYQR